jgi:hypothetical protein
MYPDTFGRAFTVKLPLKYESAFLPEEKEETALAQNFPDSTRLTSVQRLSWITYPGLNVEVRGNHERSSGYPFLA